MSYSPERARASSNRDTIDRMFRLIAAPLDQLLSDAVPAGQDWTSVLAERDSRKGITRASHYRFDPQLQLRMLTETNLLSDRLGRVGRAYATELRALRDAWAHHQPITDGDVDRALETCERLLRLIGSSEFADQVLSLKGRASEADGGPEAALGGTRSALEEVREPHQEDLAEVGESLENPIVSDVLRQQVLPFYLVCDESYSMLGDGTDAINAALPDLHAEISTNPSVADKTRFSMIGFSDNARTLLDLVDLSDVGAMPTVEAIGGTSFSSAFRLLQGQIESDVAALKAQGHRVYRPVAFFLTDGNPTDGGDWQLAFEDLKQSSMRPNIVAFGVGSGIDESIIRQIGTFQAFVSDGTLSPAAALREFATALTKSIVASGSNTNPNGAMVLQVPEVVRGFRSLEADEM